MRKNSFSCIIVLNFTFWWFLIIKSFLLSFCFFLLREQILHINSTNSILNIRANIITFVFIHATFVLNSTQIVMIVLKFVIIIVLRIKPISRRIVFCIQILVAHSSCINRVRLQTQCRHVSCLVNNLGQIHHTSYSISIKTNFLQWSPFTCYKQIHLKCFIGKCLWFKNKHIF